MITTASICHQSSDYPHKKDMVFLPRSPFLAGAVIGGTVTVMGKDPLDDPMFMDLEHCLLQTKIMSK